MLLDVVSRCLENVFGSCAGPHLLHSGEVGAIQQFHRFTLSFIEMSRNGDGSSEITFVHFEIAAEIDSHDFTSLHRPT